MEIFIVIGDHKSEDSEIIKAFYKEDDAKKLVEDCNNYASKRPKYSPGESWKQFIDKYNNWVKLHPAESDVAYNITYDYIKCEIL